MNELAQKTIDDFKENIVRWEGLPTDIKLQGAITGCLETACGKKKENRYRILKILTGKTSSKQLDGAEWDALYKLVLPWKPEGGKWGTGNPDLERICNALLNADVEQPGQTSFLQEVQDTLNEINAVTEISSDTPESMWEQHVGNPLVQPPDEEIPF